MNDSDLWKSATYCSTNACVEVAMRTFKKSSYSASGACVEMTEDGPTILVRDSKQGGVGPTLEFTRDEWIAFTKGVKVGEFDVE